MPIRLPSADIPDAQKRTFSEADVHSTLFEPDAQALGFPPRTSSQADGEYFEQAVVERVERIVAELRSDLGADVEPLRDEIDDLIFDLFEIRAARAEVRRFYRTVGLVQSVEENQAATA